MCAGYHMAIENAQEHRHELQLQFNVHEEHYVSSSATADCKLTFKAGRHLSGYEAPIRECHKCCEFAPQAWSVYSPFLGRFIIHHVTINVPLLGQPYPAALKSNGSYSQVQQDSRWDSNSTTQGNEGPLPQLATMSACMGCVNKLC